MHSSRTGLPAGAFALCLLFIYVAVTVSFLSGVAAEAARVDGAVLLPSVHTVPPVGRMARYPGSSPSYFNGSAGADRGPDGSVLFFGTTVDNDAAAMKVDGQGQVLWAKYYGGFGDDHFGAGALTADGGAVVAGVTRSFGAGNWDIWVLGLDGGGEVVWATVAGGSEAEGDYGLALVPAVGGYYVVAETRSFTASNEAWVIKLDDNGNVLWQKLIGGSGTDLARARHAVASSGGGLIFVGHTYGTELEGLMFVKVDSGGTLGWQKVFQAPCYPRALNSMPDGRLVITGFGATGACLMVLSAEVNFQWGWQFDGVDENSSQFQVAGGLANGDIMAVGYTDVGGGTDFAGWAVNFKSDGTPSWQKAYEDGTVSYPTLNAFLAEAGETVWLAGDSAGSPWLLQIAADGRIDNCPHDFDFSRAASPLAVGAGIVIEPPMADAPATILHPNITGVDLIVLWEPLCPVTGELAACPAGKKR